MFSAASGSILRATKAPKPLLAVSMEFRMEDGGEILMFEQNTGYTKADQKNLSSVVSTEGNWSLKPPVAEYCVQRRTMSLTAVALS
jgi:hypothetical protein